MSKSSRTALRALAPRVAKAAQRVYDEWDPAGEFDEYGGGGICDDVADAICDVLRESGVEDVTTYHVFDDNHTVAIALMPDGVWEVDVPSGVYETGGWYKYKRRPGVEIGVDDVAVTKLDGAWEDYAEA